MKEEQQGISGQGIITDIERIIDSKKVTFEIGGETWAREKLIRVYDEPRPSCLTVETLSGIVGYLEKNVDEVKTDECLINVEDVDRVVVSSPVQGKKNDRHTILISGISSGIESFPFGNFLPQEQFIIKLMTLFVPSADREKVVECVSGLVFDASKLEEDDGSTKKVSEHSGVTPVNGDPPKVPVLKPYRTFREIDQPESPFVLRYKQSGNGIVIALFEADGGVWRYKAVCDIAAYLQKALPAGRIIF